MERAREPDRSSRVPPGRDLDRLQRGERVDQLAVVLEGADRDVQVEPVGLAGEAVERHLVPARGEPVEVLEDVAVAAADAGVLGHIDDTQAPVGGAHRPRVEELAPARPEVALGLALALTDVGAAGDRLAMHQHRGGGEGDTVPGLPAAQAVVDVLVGHRVALVELADLIDQRPAQVHARAGHREHRAGRSSRGPKLAGLKRKRWSNHWRAPRFRTVPANWILPSG